MDVKGFQRDLLTVQTLYKNQIKTSIPNHKLQKDPKT